MKQKFIKTTNTATAEKMISEGFKLVSQNGQVYTFLNDVSEAFHFDSADMKHVAYSDVLTF